jgi:hypothetical protein
MEIKKEICVHSCSFVAELLNQAALNVEVENAVDAIFDMASEI